MGWMNNPNTQTANWSEIRAQTICPMTKLLNYMLNVLLDQEELMDQKVYLGFMKWRTKTSFL